MGKEDVQSLLPLVSHILQNIGLLLIIFIYFFLLFIDLFINYSKTKIIIELNTNEIDVQVASFDTLAKFLSKVRDTISADTLNRVKLVCEGSKFLAEDQRELKFSIERVVEKL